MNDAFAKQMADGYALDQPAVLLGSAMLDNDVCTTTSHVQVALSILNRHGLIAGATGTGKTKTLQLMAGQLSKAGVPCFVADIKGDVTGMAAPGDATNPIVTQRMQSLELPYTPSAHPVEFLSLSGKRGAQVRATVHSFGPLLLGKVLGLNDTQTSILALIFKYCDDNNYPLLDLKDLAEALKFLSSDAGKGALADYGGMSPASVGVLLRSIIVLEQQGADIFFGEPEFDVADLLRTTADGQGIVSLLELSDVMDQPRALLDVHALDARPAVRDAARGGRPAQAQAVLLLRRGASALRRRLGRAHAGDRAHGATDPVEGRWRLLRHAVAHGRALVRAVAAGQPSPARAARLHARGCGQPAKDGADVPDDRVLRRREAAHLARHRRGGDHRPVAARSADAARGDEADRARLADVADPRRPVRGPRRREPAAGEIRRDGRSRECLRDHQGPH